jgi:hypothetical protein
MVDSFGKPIGVRACVTITRGSPICKPNGILKI